MVRIEGQNALDRWRLNLCSYDPDGSHQRRDSSRREKLSTWRGRRWLVLAGQTVYLVLAFAERPVESWALDLGSVAQTTWVVPLITPVDMWSRMPTEKALREDPPY